MTPPCAFANYGTLGNLPDGCHFCRKLMIPRKKLANMV